MILSQATLLCLTALVFGKKTNTFSIGNNCRKCPESCQDTGECTEGCLAGYYGHSCTKTCDPHCGRNICQQQDGHCACVVGYLYRNSRCEEDTGQQCQTPGCRNDRCSSTGNQECLEGCKPGLFGYFCESPCEDNCLCDQRSGNCTDCLHGWFGPKCKSMCSDGCSGGCYRNGSCFNGCKPGSIGETCEFKCSSDCVSGCDQLSGECVECKERRYGPNCQSDCSDRCAGCDREGQCIKGCVESYYGDKCEFICPQHCNGGSCDQNGTCIKSTCPPQCDGGSCDLGGTCTACKTGFYGPRCSKICEGCVEGGCHKENGNCVNTAENGNSWNTYIIGGGVLLIVIVLAVFLICCLKRMQGIVHNGLTSIGEAVQFESGLNAPVCSFSNIRSCGSSHASDSTYNHLFAFKPFSVDSSFDNLETASGYCSVRLEGRSGVSDGNRSQSALPEEACGGIEGDGKAKNTCTIVCLRPKEDKEAVFGDEDEWDITRNVMDIKVNKICKLKNKCNADAGITDVVREKACLKFIEDNEIKNEEIMIISLIPNEKEDEVHTSFQKQNIQLNIVDDKIPKMTDKEEAMRRTQGWGDQVEVRMMASRSLYPNDTGDSDGKVTREGTVRGQRGVFSDDQANAAGLEDLQTRNPDENINLADEDEAFGGQANTDGKNMSMTFEGCQSNDDEEKVAIQDGASGDVIRKEEWNKESKAIDGEENEKSLASDVRPSQLSRQSVQPQGRNKNSFLFDDSQQSLHGDMSDVSKTKTRKKDTEMYPYVDIIVIEK